MDSLFLDIVLFFVSGCIEDDCPRPKGSTSIVCGATLSKRKANTRIEIWLGGHEIPSQLWTDAIFRFFAKCFPAFKLFPYRSFHDHKDLK